MPLSLPCLVALRPGRPFQLLLLLLLLAAAPTQAQTPAWQTALALNSRFSSIRATAAAANGDLYVAGSFTETISLDGIALTSAGSDDLFVAKWSSTAHRFVWAQRAGGDYQDYPTALAVQGTSVYVSGDFQGPAADFGTLTLTNAAGTPPNGDRNAFITRLTDAGPSAHFAWAYQAGGEEDDFTTGLAVSGPNVYVTGYFTGPTARFGSTTLRKLNPRGNDVFLTKLTDDGPSARFVWTQQASGRSLDGHSAVAVQGASVYLVGAFFQTTRLGNTTLTNAAMDGTSDIFIARFTDAGTSSQVDWAQRVGGSSEDDPIAVTVAGDNVYVVGVFTGSASFGATTLTSRDATDSDVFVTKLTTAGTIGWAQRAGGSGEDYATAVVVQGTSVYVAGNFASATADFGSTTLTNAAATPAESDYDVFMAQLVDAGNSSRFVWAQSAGGEGEDYASTLTLVSPRLYVGGSVGTPASFGAHTISSALGTEVGFLAWLTEAGAPLAGRPATRLTGGVQLYPNPARAMVTVQVPGLADVTGLTLTLRDGLGRAVRTQQHPLPRGGAQATVALMGLPPGLYQVQVQAGAEHFTCPLVIE